MARDHRAPDRDRLLIARLDGIARRHARWGGLTEAEKGAGAGELHGVAGDRRDLLAEVAGLALGTAEGKGQEYQARGQAIAELCRMAGADESLIPQWHQVGRQRAAMRQAAVQLGRADIQHGQADGVKGASGDRRIHHEP